VQINKFLAHVHLYSQFVIQV